MQDQKPYFYDKFVSESNLVVINDILIQRKYWIYSFSIALFCLISGTIPTFIGYNFENVFAICAFVWELLMFSFLLYFSIKLVLLDKKYRVFRKRYYALLFSSVYCLLAFVFAFVANFTTKFISYPDTSFSVNFNPMFYFLIFLPIFFGYVIFCYYAFMKCFGKYTKGGRNSNKYF